MRTAFANRIRLSLLLLCISGIASAIGLPGNYAPLQQPFGIQDDGQPPLRRTSSNGTLSEFLDALDVLQDNYFASWLGMWPSSIDWTAAVIGTYVSAALTTISQSDSTDENLINTYFSHLIAYYFGQDAFSLRQEAYDDMLWVVLGWLETIKFIDVHSSLHYASTPWYGTLWTSAFAHRARLFWDMASQGWDTSLCGGGMIWSPYLEPYKNTITNELFISASISMYLYFPGDNNASPFMTETMPAMDTASVPPGVARDPKYLAAAVVAYKWLKGSNMTDSQGLLVDGYHITGYVNSTSGGTKLCDSRNEMVYTYNQGVLLSGQRGLYEATGAKSYLEDGHQLVLDVIAATGWNITTQLPPANGTANYGVWEGLGRNGTLEEACDSAGTCSQDAQTFKGIFFHHLTLFCAFIPEYLVLPDNGTLDPSSLNETRTYHTENCKNYSKWIGHNAKGALATKTSTGLFGMWWDASDELADGKEINSIIPEMGIDYRNLGVPESWNGDPLPPSNKNKGLGVEVSTVQKFSDEIEILDLNDRGRGRTVETQGGGLSVLRAAWELVDRWEG